MAFFLLELNILAVVCVCAVTISSHCEGEIKIKLPCSITYFSFVAFCGFLCSTGAREVMAYAIRTSTRGLNGSDQLYYKPKRSLLVNRLSSCWHWT